MLEIAKCGGLACEPVKGGGVRFLAALRSVAPEPTLVSQGCHVFSM